MIKNYFFNIKILGAGFVVALSLMVTPHSFAGLSDAQKVAQAKENAEYIKNIVTTSDVGAAITEKCKLVAPGSSVQVSIVMYVFTQTDVMMTKAVFEADRKAGKPKAKGTEGAKEEFTIMVTAICGSSFRSFEVSGTVTPGALGVFERANKVLKTSGGGDGGGNNNGGGAGAGGGSGGGGDSGNQLDKFCAGKKDGVYYLFVPKSDPIGGPYSKYDEKKPGESSSQFWKILITIKCNSGKFVDDTGLNGGKNQGRIGLPSRTITTPDGKKSSRWSVESPLVVASAVIVDAPKSGGGVSAKVSYLDIQTEPGAYTRIYKVIPTTGKIVEARIPLGGKSPVNMSWNKVSASVNGLGLAASQSIWSARRNGDAIIFRGSVPLEKGIESAFNIKFEGDSSVDQRGKDKEEIAVELVDMSGTLTAVPASSVLPVIPVPAVAPPVVPGIVPTIINEPLKENPPERG